MCEQLELAKTLLPSQRKLRAFYSSVTLSSQRRNKYVVKKWPSNPILIICQHQWFLFQISWFHTPLERCQFVSNSPGVMRRWSLLQKKSEFRNWNKTTRKIFKCLTISLKCFIFPFSVFNRIPNPFVFWKLWVAVLGKIDLRSSRKCEMTIFHILL